MVSAKKYFSQPDEAAEKKPYGTSNGSDSSQGLNKTIEKVKKKVSERYFSPSGSQPYIPPLPEQVMPDKNADSLDDIVEGRKGVRTPVGSSGSSGSRTRPCTPSSSGGISKPRTSSHPFEYVMGEVLENVRSSVVKDPTEPGYQFSRKVVSRFMKEPKTAFDIIVQEAAMMGLYTFIGRLLTKKIRP
ncbi:hypothetical protein JW756_05060 [Candidatus Woesearchaeota archaeon]|nr:hypothetical protein [Candidatus Woesearchaeota archaeon]